MGRKFIVGVVGVKWELGTAVDDVAVGKEEQMKHFLGLLMV